MNHVKYQLPYITIRSGHAVFTLVTLVTISYDSVFTLYSSWHRTISSSPSSLHAILPIAPPPLQIRLLCLVCRHLQTIGTIMLSGESIYLLPASMVEISAHSMLPICLADCSTENSTEHWPGIIVETQDNCMNASVVQLHPTLRLHFASTAMSYRNRAPSTRPLLDPLFPPLMLLPNRVCCSSNHHLWPQVGA
jgi:hypothetical protein